MIALRISIALVLAAAFALPAADAISCYDCNGHVATRDSCDIVTADTATVTCEGADVCVSFINPIITQERLIIRTCHNKGICNNKGFCVECDSDFCNTVY